jgi:hypothetical protein
MGESRIERDVDKFARRCFCEGRERVGDVSFTRPGADCVLRNREPGENGEFAGPDFKGTHEPAASGWPDDDLSARWFVRMSSSGPAADVGNVQVARSH